MVSLAELDVDEYGSVDSTFAIPVPLWEHDWRTPYPPLPRDAVIPFVRASGDGPLASFTWFRGLWDWVCDDSAYELLMDLAPADVNVIGSGLLDGQQLRIVQVVGLLDIVDMEHSITRKYPTYEILDFPAFPAAVAERTAGRLFRVPQSVNMTFVGADVQAAIESSGLQGLRFAGADWT